MRLIHLSQCYFYSPVKTKTDGEIKTEWKYKTKYLLNKQQDINELDRNESGVIDYEKVKLRTDKPIDMIDVKKGDGVSFELLKEPIKPTYLVTSHTVVGNSHLIICETYHGE